MCFGGPSEPYKGRGVLEVLQNHIRAGVCFGGLSEPYEGRGVAH